MVKLQTLVKKYVTETNISEAHSFCSMVMQKNILNEFINFLGDSKATQEMLSLANLIKFRDMVFKPKMEHFEKEAEKIGIPFELYLDLLPLPVMNQNMIDRYINDLGRFIDWCHSDKTQ